MKKICRECLRKYSTDNHRRKYCSLPCAYSSKDRVKNVPYKFSEEEINRVREIYRQNPETGFLIELSKELRRTKCSISSLANRLGLTARRRKRSLEHLKKMSVSRKELQKQRPDLLEKFQAGRAKLVKEGKHPRGMLGKKHSAKTRIMMSNERKGKKKSPEHIRKIMEARIKHGNFISPRPKGSWQSGWETIGNRRFYFRSSWEKEYAHYLSFMVRIKEIKDWDYEPDTLWFNKIKRGVRSYTPDFKIYKNDGNIEYHEVKGWMDSRSQTKIKRTRKYYPNITLKIIEKQDLKDLGII